MTQRHGAVGNGPLEHVAVETRLTRQHLGLGAGVAAERLDIERQRHRDVLKRREVLEKDDPLAIEHCRFEEVLERVAARGDLFLPGA